MRINVKQGIRDYEGKFIETNKVGDNGVTVLDSHNQPVKVIEELRTYLINALNNQLPGENILAEDKAQIYALSIKIYSDKIVDFTHHELSFMEERVGKIYGPLIYGRICEIFNGDGPVAEDVKSENVKEKKSAVEG